MLRSLRLVNNVSGRRCGSGLMTIWVGMLPWDTIDGAVGATGNGTKVWRDLDDGFELPVLGLCSVDGSSHSIAGSKNGSSPAR